MANAEELNATMATIRKNLHLWDQAHYFTRTECGTTACFDGWTLLRHGYEPTSLRFPGMVAQRILGLTSWEHDNLAFYFTSNIEDLELRVKEIIAGEWADHPDGEVAW